MKQNLPFLNFFLKKWPFLFSSLVVKVGKRWGIEAIQHLLSSSTTSASDNPSGRRAEDSFALFLLYLLTSLKDCESETAFHFHWRFDQFEILDWGFVASLFLPWIVFLDFRVWPETVSLKLQICVLTLGRIRRSFACACARFSLGCWNDLVLRLIW